MIQRELYHPKCSRKVSGLSRNGPQEREPLRDNTNSYADQYLFHSAKSSEKFLIPEMRKWKYLNKISGVWLRSTELSHFTSVSEVESATSPAWLPKANSSRYSQLIIHPCFVRCIILNFRDCIAGVDRRVGGLIFIIVASWWLYHVQCLQANEYIHYFVVLSIGLNTEVSFLLLISFKKLIKPIFKQELKHILPMASVVLLKSCQSANRVQVNQLFLSTTYNSCYYSYQRSWHTNEANGSFPIVLSP